MGAGRPVGRTPTPVFQTVSIIVVILIVLLILLLLGYR